MSDKLTPYEIATGHKTEEQKEIYKKATNERAKRAYEYWRSKQRGDTYIPLWENLTEITTDVWIEIVTTLCKEFIADEENLIISAIESTNVQMGEQDPIWDKVYDAISELSEKYIGR